MECNRYLEQLDLANTAKTDELFFSDALDHVEQCPECRKKLSKRFESENEIINQLESSIDVPESLYESIENQTRNYHRSRNKYITIGILAASVILVLGISFTGWNQWQEHKKVSAVKKLCVVSIRNHELTSHPEYIARNRHEVSEWLTDRMGQVIKFPRDFDVHGVTLAAKRVVLGEHPAAAIEFDINDKRSTLFSYRPEQYDVKGVTDPPKSAMGYTVAVWSEDGLGYSLVSEASPDEVNSFFQDVSLSAQASTY